MGAFLGPRWSKACSIRLQAPFRGDEQRIPMVRLAFRAGSAGAHRPAERNNLEVGRSIWQSAAVHLDRLRGRSVVDVLVETGIENPVGKSLTSWNCRLTIAYLPGANP